MLDGIQHGRGDAAERLGSEPVDSQRPDLLAHREAGVAQAAVRGPDLDMDREASPAGGKGHGDDEVGSSLVEPVRGDDEHRSRSGLLGPSGWLQIGQPDLASANGSHRSSSPSASVPSSSLCSARYSSHATGSAWSRS